MTDSCTKIKQPSLAENLAELRAFLGCATPQSWLDMAKCPSQLAILLIDHANCERKAATTALALAARYVHHPQFLLPLSRLAREELHHFEQVIGLMAERQIPYRALSASRYAGGLHAQVRGDEPGRLVDLLIVGAFIEARSCERFAALAPLLDDAELSRFYRQLLRSEARHYRTYLDFARELGTGDVDERIALFRGCENELVQSSDRQFRFHSGVPVSA